jgi:release factor glutamine methyltransferase
MFRVAKWFLTHVSGPILKWYLKKDRNFHYNGIDLLVKQGVFHPGFFFSTKFLLHTINKEPVAGLKFLELGAGSGLISFYFSRKGANVLATDINSKAIEGLEFNQKNLKSNVQILQSDLFKQIPKQTFDIIVVNPPFYPKNPQNQEEMAWFCGADFQYFYNFFSQIGEYIHADSKVFMSLSIDCNIPKIQEIGTEYNFKFSLLEKKRILGELNYIYQIFKS